jgi:hypothetical protein
MALSPNIIYAALAANRFSGIFPFPGWNYDLLSTGIANGVYTWIVNPSNVTLSGITSGGTGAGSVNGLLSAVPNSDLLYRALSAAGVAGSLSLSLSMAVTIGIVTAIQMNGQYVGVSAGVGLGSDISKVIQANPVTLIAGLIESLSATLGRGPALSLMATGLGNGISQLILTVTGAGSVLATGPVGTPGTGTSVSTIL